MMEFIKEKGDSFAHSYFYLAAMFFSCFLGWALDSLYVTFLSISLFLIVTPILTKDVRLLLALCIMAFSGFRSRFYFNDASVLIIITVVSLFISIVLFLYKNRNEMKFDPGTIFKSLVVFFAICLLSTIIRNGFNNHYAFDGYVYEIPDRIKDLNWVSHLKDYTYVPFENWTNYYNIMYGYLFSLIFILFISLSLLISTIKRSDYKETYTKIMYIFSIMLIIETLIGYFITYVIDTSHYNSRPYYILGWCEKNMFCVCIEIMIPFIFIGYLSNRKRIDYLVVIFVLSVLVLIGKSTGGKITILAMMLLISIILVQQKLKNEILIHRIKKSVFIAIITSFIIFLTLLIITPTRNRVVSLVNSFITHNGRDVFWTWIFDYTFKTNALNALFGGSPSFLFELWNPFCFVFSYENVDTTGIFMCHSNIIQSIAIGGIFGLLAFLYIVVESCLAIKKTKGNFKYLLLLFLFVGLFHGIIDNLFYSVFYLIPFLMIFSEKEELLDKKTKNNDEKEITTYDAN